MQGVTRQCDLFAVPVADLDRARGVEALMLSCRELRLQLRWQPSGEVGVEGVAMLPETARACTHAHIHTHARTPARPHARTPARPHAPKRNHTRTRSCAARTRACSLAHSTGTAQAQHRHARGMGRCPGQPRTWDGCRLPVPGRCRPEATFAARSRRRWPPSSTRRR